MWWSSVDHMHWMTKSPPPPALAKLYHAKIFYAFNIKTVYNAWNIQTVNKTLKLTVGGKADTAVTGKADNWKRGDFHQNAKDIMIFSETQKLPIQTAECRWNRIFCEFFSKHVLAFVSPHFICKCIFSKNKVLQRAVSRLSGRPLIFFKVST